MDHMDMEEKLIPNPRDLKWRMKLLYILIGFTVGCLVTFGMCYLCFSLGKTKVISGSPSSSPRTEKQQQQQQTTNDSISRDESLKVLLAKQDNATKILQNISDKKTQEIQLLQQSKSENRQLISDLKNRSMTAMKFMTESRRVITQKLTDMNNDSIEDKRRLTTVLVNNSRQSTEYIRTLLQDFTKRLLNKHDLEALMKYVQSFKNDTKKDDTTTPKKDCVEWKQSGFTKDGLYMITPSEGVVVQVYCDMTTDGGGWLVFQRRVNGTTDFNRVWKDYEDGFGYLEDEFWLGNKYLHVLTSKTPTELRIDLQDWKDEKRYAKYSSFSLGDAASKYALSVGGYSGNAGDGLNFHHSRMFTTRDQDNDVKGNGCATKYKGAWWYGYCSHASLNGEYIWGGRAGHNAGVNWQKWKGDNYSLKRASMMLRRKS